MDLVEVISFLLMLSTTELGKVLENMPFSRDDDAMTPVLA